MFPPSHPIRTSWSAARKRAQSIDHWAKRPNPERNISLVEGIKADTVGECLDVAETLLGAKHVVAATVVAGGALEVHLRHLCSRFGVSWSGSGSIEKYNQALAQARNNGTPTILNTDTKSVTARGERRNDAAHGPVNFTGTAEEIRLMIEGIRQFVARTQ